MPGSAGPTKGRWYTHLFGCGWRPRYDIGYPAYWDQNGEFKKCQNWGNIAWIESAGNENNLKEVLISNVRAILLVDLAKCEDVKVLVDYEKQGNFSVNGILGISYSPDSQELLYGIELYGLAYPKAEYRIMKLNLRTGAELMLAEGIHPSWSPDGSQISYVQADGIYIMKADGTQHRLLVKHSFADSRSSMPFHTLQPMPHWSPDGAWLVYHRCEECSCFVSENAIYKVEIATGKE